jgi:hypothetical protein
MKREGDRFVATVAGWYQLSTATGKRFLHLTDEQVAELGLGPDGEVVPGFVRAAAEHAELSAVRTEAVVEAAKAVAEAERRQGDYSAKEHWERTAALIAAVDALNEVTL